MPRLFFEADNCKGATSGSTGREYKADKQGFITVNDSTDVKLFKANGYFEAGGMPKVSKYWVCDACAWDAVFNHCGKCGSENLRKIEK